MNVVTPAQYIKFDVNTLFPNKEMYILIVDIIHSDLWKYDIALCGNETKWMKSQMSVVNQVLYLLTYFENHIKKTDTF